MYITLHNMKGKEMENFSAKAIFNDIRNFLAGRFVGATRDEFLLEEVIKLINFIPDFFSIKI